MGVADLSAECAERLRSLQYEAEAEMCVLALPYAGVYWADEVPYPDFRFSELDGQIVSDVLFVRVKLWKGEGLTPEEEQLWWDARLAFPAWPVFRRLHVPDEVLAQQTSAEASGDEMWDALMAIEDDLSG